MKNEINLRTREFTMARGFYLPRFLTIMAVILLLILVAGGGLFIHLSRVNLEADHQALIQEKEALQVAVAPLDALENQIRGLLNREGLLDRLLSDGPPWSALYRDILSTAVATGPQVKVLATGSGGLIGIEGDSPTMKQVALFTQALEAVPGATAARHQAITYSADLKKFGYEIDLFTANGGEQ